MADVEFTPKAATDLKRVQQEQHLAEIHRGENKARTDETPPEERGNKKEKIGRRSEARVAEGLDFLISCGGIHDYYKSWRKGELDLRGVDFLIVPEPSYDHMIPLQVKSSLTGVREHRKISRIPCILAKHNIPLVLFAEELMQVMGLSTEFLKEIIRAREYSCSGSLAQKIRETINPFEERQEVLIDKLVNDLVSTP